MVKKYFSILVCVLFGTLCCLFSSCSDNDEVGGDDNNGSFVINGERYKVIDAGVSAGVWTEDAFVGRMFEARLFGSDGFFEYIMEYVYSNNGNYSFRLIEGDITDYIHVDTCSHQNSVNFTDYTYIRGKVFSTLNKNTVTLDFQDYTFKSRRGTKYVVNGSVQYEIDDY